jgi:hypothetical protein
MLRRGGTVWRTGRRALRRPPWSVFLSHTSDLDVFVAAAKSAVVQARHVAIDMSQFSASDLPPADYCVRTVEGADVYVGIIGLTYGTPVRDGPDRSYTELEFDAATDGGLPRLVFLIREDAPFLSTAGGRGERDVRQEAFRRRLRSADLMIAEIASPADLERRLLQALHELRLASVESDREPAGQARARRDLADEVRRQFVQEELERSLERVARIDLGLTERPEAVDPPLRVIVRGPAEPDLLIEPGTPIRDVYMRMGKQLLVLGEPGSGKTTLILELVRQLLDDPDPAWPDRIPTVFHLASWSRQRPPLATWMVEELHRQYGVARPLGRTWVDTGSILPFFDGLDEVAAGCREECLAAINAFRDEHGQLPLVVSSRTGEYDALQAGSDCAERWSSSR